MYYYLKSGNEKLGPFTEKEIINGLRAGKISLFDMIFHNQKNVWVMVMQHSDFCDLEISPEGDQEEEGDPPSPLQIGLSLQEFVAPADFPANLEGDLDAGLERPYWFEKSNPGQAHKFLDILSLLHSKKFSEQTLLSRGPHGPWKPLLEWDDFSANSLSEFKRNTPGTIPDVSIRRKHARFDYGKTVIVATQAKAFKAFCPDISKSGMSFIATTLRLAIDENVFVKFGETLENNVFDVKAVVVGVRKIQVPDTGALYFRYALRFTHISENFKRRILDLEK